MKRLLHGAALAATVICHTPASAQTAYTCGQGTVHRADALFETVTPETITTRPGVDAVATVETGDGQSRQTMVVAVQLGDRLYVSRSSGDPDGALDPLQLEPGDSIDICVSRTQMILERPDGSDFRAPLEIGNPAPQIRNPSRTLRARTP